MSIIDKLSEKETWEAFYQHKLKQGNINPKDANDLQQFIDSGAFLEIADHLRRGEPLSLPQKTLINKSKSGKKRAVYTFNREENYALKVLSFLLRDYDYLFAPNLYSFRRNSGVKRAVEDVLRIKDLNRRYVYKLDISNYFNTVDIGLLLPMLKEVFADDEKLFMFFESMLTNPYAEYEGERICESKGIMAGTPVSAFLANLYLRDLDQWFFSQKIPYLRYSDDILVFAKNEVQLSESVQIIKQCLRDRHLEINPDKESVSAPGEKWTFLGFSYHEGVIDVSDVSVQKLKAKMRRKARALSRWAGKKNLPGEYAAKAFIRRFNAKLYDNPVYSELTWTRWFFPVINTTDTLNEIDRYTQDCIRFLATGTRTKARFQFRYEDMKALGYKSLVHEYYNIKQEENEV